MPRAERKAAIEALETERGGTNVITYVTSTRTGAEAQMAMDAIDRFHRHLLLLGSPPDETRIDLYIHSNGGEGIVPWRLVTLLREYCDEFAVLVPNRAFSAATLTALGADEVIMHPMGMLGPTDPTVTNEFNPPHPNIPNQLLGISVEDVASYIALVKEDVGIHHEDEVIQAFLSLSDKVHPLALGNVKRSTQQSRMMGEKLLRTRAKGEQLADHAIEEIIRKLTSELYFHGHPINRSEARNDVGLSFVKDATPAVAERMWALWQAYEADMKLDQAFSPVHEALQKNPLPVPAGQNMPPNHAVVPLDTHKVVYVESTGRCDVFESEYQVVLLRDFMGTYNSQLGVMRQEWAEEV